MHVVKRFPPPESNRYASASDGVQREGTRDADLIKTRRPDIEWKK